VVATPFFTINDYELANKVGFNSLIISMKTNLALVKLINLHFLEWLLIYMKGKMIRNIRFSIATSAFFFPLLVANEHYFATFI
jgi:hypothetical protein